MKRYFASLLFGIIVFSGVSQEPTARLEKDGKDPVCGMKIKKGTSLVSVYKEKQHGFCSKVCKERFDKDPEKYVKK